LLPVLTEFFFVMVAHAADWASSICLSHRRSAFASVSAFRRSVWERLASVVAVTVLSVSTLTLTGCGRQTESMLPPTATPSEKVAPGENLRGENLRGEKSLAEVVHESQPISPAMLESWLSNPSLRRLKLAGSDIDDVGLAKLADKAKLELLDVTGCEAITPEGIRSIGKMTSLRNLRVSGAAVNDQSVQSLAGLDRMAALSLQQTAVTDEGIDVVRPMRGLKELNLYGTPVTDASLATIASLPSLQKLRLRGTGVRGECAESFAQMAQVIDLDLSETKFGSEGLASVGKMPKLVRLNLWLTEVDDTGIESLAPLKALTHLNLDNVRGITDRSLSRISEMSELELLHLGGTSVTAAGLPRLYGLKNMKSLFVTRLGLTDQEVASLREAMPWVEKFES